MSTQIEPAERTVLLFPLEPASHRCSFAKDYLDAKMFVLNVQTMTAKQECAKEVLIPSLSYIRGSAGAVCHMVYEYIPSCVQMQLRASNP